MNRREVGQSGEDFALKYVLSEGFVVMGRNVYFNESEIDLVAQDAAGNIHLIEVKTSSVESVLDVTHEIDPGLQVDKRKWNAMIVAQKHFEYAYGLKNRSTILSLIKVYLAKDYKNAGERARVEMLSPFELHF